MSQIHDKKENSLAVPKSLPFKGTKNVSGTANGQFFPARLVEEMTSGGTKCPLTLGERREQVKWLRVRRLSFDNAAPPLQIRRPQIERDRKFMSWTLLSSLLQRLVVLHKFYHSSSHPSFPHLTFPLSSSDFISLPTFFILQRCSLNKSNFIASNSNNRRRIRTEMKKFLFFDNVIKNIFRMLSGFYEESLQTSFSP